MGRIRKEAVNLVLHRGWSTRKVARHTGFSQSAIVKWCKRDICGGWRAIPTRSSKPKSHAKQLSKEVVDRIVALRFETKRCAEVIHQMMSREGMKVSLSSVKRTLKRHYLIPYRDGRKRWHFSPPRPEAQKPGDLMQIDTIHIMKDRIKRLYVFTLIDLNSRWAFAKAYDAIAGSTTIRFVKEAQTHAPFRFGHLQTDHGPEFSRWFKHMIGIKRRHSRVRKPNDNAHIERFNRTLREECLDGLPRTVEAINQALPEYLNFYNSKRPHMGLNTKPP